MKTVKEWVRSNQEKIHTLPVYIGIVVFVGLFLMGFFIGFGYFAAAVLFLGFYLFALQSANERIVSPKELKEIEEALNDLYEKRSIFEEHLREFPEDLNAKLELNELQKEIKSLEKERGDE
ncbi:hypothetical protein IMZ31_20915 (plasmid) [Pontibacillus sp. ALD_SL1]|uniref:hypothetical protein n=1 Tax=Pontibacillus sp. ALD_SL1 TaxID=2777185 RepID=UPI001A96D51F|nr:hypothetical protein [Pontibacillus sp. ALD_SL1]QST03011.1 hypothetical protein IMZ31_20915 [Pontibacillus sp. ALD_SL1]